MKVPKAPRGWPIPIPNVMDTVRFKGRRWYCVEHALTFGTGSITGNRLMKVSVYFECPRIARKVARRRGGAK